MKNTFLILFGVVLLNFFLLSYEFQGTGKGWRLYGALAVILIISAISLPIGIVLLIPITAYNILWNTSRLLQRRG